MKYNGRMSTPSENIGATPTRPSIFMVIEPTVDSIHSTATRLSAAIRIIDPEAKDQPESLEGIHEILGSIHRCLAANSDQPSRQAGTVAAHMDSVTALLTPATLGQVPMESLKIIADELGFLRDSLTLLLPPQTMSPSQILFQKSSIGHRPA